MGRGVEAIRRRSSRQRISSAPAAGSTALIGDSVAAAPVKVACGTGMSWPRLSPLGEMDRAGLGQLPVQGEGVVEPPGLDHPFERVAVRLPAVARPLGVKVPARWGPEQPGRGERDDPPAELALDRHRPLRVHLDPEPPGAARPVPGHRHVGRAKDLPAPLVGDDHRQALIGRRLLGHPVPPRRTGPQSPAHPPAVVENPERLEVERGRHPGLGRRQPRFQVGDLRRQFGAAGLGSVTQGPSPRRSGGTGGSRPTRRCRGAWRRTRLGPSGPPLWSGP